MPRKIPRAYCDTSVIGGILDDEFARPSIRFLGYVKSGMINLVLSPVVDAEINTVNTPDAVVREYKELLKFCEIIEVSDEALQLQQQYIKEKILTPKWEDDALHVACASVSECDFIVSWNFKHIVNFQKIPLYNAVNKLHGYHELQIYSPLEVEL